MGGVYHQHLRLYGLARVLHGSFELRDIRHMLPIGTQAAGMHGEINHRQQTRCACAVAQHVVEWRTAAGLLQALDATEPAVVQHHDDEFHAQHDRSGDFRVHHQVGAVAHHHDHLLLRACHLHAQATGNLVSHTGVAILHVVVARRSRTPELVQLGRQRTGGANHHVVLVAVGYGVAHRTNHFGLKGQDASVLRVGIRRGDLRHTGHPGSRHVAGGRGPGRFSAPVSDGF